MNEDDADGIIAGIADALAFVRGDGARARVVFAATTMDEVFGCLPPNGPALSIDEMNAAVAEQAARRAREC